MRTVSRVLPLVAALAIAGGSGLLAQGGFTIEAGVISSAGASDLQAGIRTDAVKSRGVGVEFSISTLPKALSEGVFVGISDLGPVGAIPVGGSAWLMPHAGLSGLVGVAGSDAGGALGFDVGLGVLAKPGAGAGVRLDLTHREFYKDGMSLGLTTLSVGFAFGH
jgi:hypothetical protein